MKIIFMWRGTTLCFKGNSAQLFYEGLKFKKLDWAILGGVFLILYRNCERKGLRRYWISFRMAVFISLILAGLIPSSTEAVEPPGTNLNPSIERLHLEKSGPGPRAKEKNYS